MPWGLVAATVAVVVLAAAVVVVAVREDRDQGQGDQSPAGKAAAAARIDGITVQPFSGGAATGHTSDPVDYAESPPFGGRHDGQWADCTGTVYSTPIRNENAVHSLEHGAIWITYRPGLPAADLDALTQRVEGREHMLLSPYPGLRAAVSLQSWGHQLFVDSADDPRVTAFVDDLRLNPATAPEVGASCVNPDFAADPRPPQAASR